MRMRWMVGTCLGLLLGVGVAWCTEPRVTQVSRSFEIGAGSGSIVLNDVLVGPGHRVVSKFSGKRAAKCLDGTADDDYCRQFLENGTGTAFIDCDTDRSWRLRTKIDGVSTQLTGNVDPTGAFMMSGHHALSGADLFLVGKAKLDKGTVLPKSLSGVLYFTSTTIEEFGSVKFKSLRQLAN